MDVRSGKGQRSAREVESLIAVERSLVFAFASRRIPLSAGSIVTRRLPIAMSHGQGCKVWDVNGKCYLDALGGIAVNTLGHNHPKLVPALQHQLTQLIHCSN